MAALGSVSGPTSNICSHQQLHRPALTPGSAGPGPGPQRRLWDRPPPGWTSSAGSEPQESARETLVIRPGWSAQARLVTEVSPDVSWFLDLPSDGGGAAAPLLHSVMKSSRNPSLLMAPLQKRLCGSALTGTFLRRRTSERERDNGGGEGVVFWLADV